MKQLKTVSSQLNLEKIFNNNYFLLLVGLAVFKIFLIRNSEVLAGLQDRFFYAEIADHKIWFSPDITADMVIRPPGYPLFIFLSSLLGFPLRLAHEFFYIASLCFLLYALRLLKIPKIICLLFFTVSLFYPYTFVYFNDVMSESIYISLINFIIGLTIILFSTKKNSSLWLYSFILGITIGFALISRLESIVVYLYFFSIFVIIVIKNFKRLSNKKIKNTFKQVICICIIPLIIAKLIIFGTVSLNQAFLGLPGLTIGSSPGLKGTISKLLQIDTGNQLRYIPISKAQLEAAYQVSPTLKELKPYIDNVNPTSTTEMLGGNNPNNEIRRGSIGITLIYLTQQHLDNDTPKNVNEFFTRINKELESAFKNNQLPTYKFVGNPIDPRWNIWLPYVDDSLRKISYKFLFPPIEIVQNASFKDDPRANENQIYIFNKVANRRTAIVGSNNDKLKNYLVKFMYGVYLINFLGLLSFIVLFIYYFMLKRHSLLLLNYISIVSIILCLFLSRILLYSLIDASAWIIQFRYIFPMLPLFSSLSIVNLWVVINLVIHHRSNKLIERVR